MRRALVAAELTARPVTDAEVAAFKEAHEAEIPPDAPVDQLDLQVRQHLQGEREQQIRAEIVGRAKVPCTSSRRACRSRAADPRSGRPRRR